MARGRRAQFGFLTKMRLNQTLGLAILCSVQATARGKHNTVVDSSVSMTPHRCRSDTTDVFRVRTTHIRSPRSPFIRLKLQTGRSLFVRGGTLKSMADCLSRITKDIGGSKTKSWIVLILSICNETLAVTLTKIARDASDLRLLGIAIAMYIMTVLGLATSLGQIDVSTAYAVWSALGTSIVTVAGFLLFGESCNLKKLACLSCILVGVVGLNLLD